MKIIIALILSYLIGSIPTAYIFGKKTKGIDIREHGSGNVGATNVFRVLGKIPGIFVLILDIIKGVLPVVLLGTFFQLDKTVYLILLGCAAVCGHNWTIFLSFKGGKGIATSFGVLIGLMIKIALFRPVVFGTFLIWVVFFVLTRIVSIASLVASICLPILMLVTGQEFEMVVLGVVFCVFVVVRHKSNIKRLLEGKEPKVPLKKTKADDV